MVDSFIPTSRTQEPLKIIKQKFGSDIDKELLEDEDICFLLGIIHKLR
jgi:hypothetical protein